MVLARVAAVAAVLLHLSCREAELSVNVVAVLVDTDVAAIAYVGATLAAVIACRVPPTRLRSHPCPSRVA